MADEQIIYLSPGEEITHVLERLAAVQVQRIILVIPAQTPLTDRSAWKLLHQRMRQLQKSVLVISADRRVQSVAKMVGFHVAASLASTPPSRATSAPPPASSPRHASPAKNAAHFQTRSGRRSSRPLSPAPPEVDRPFSGPTAQEAYRSRQPSQNLEAQLPPSAPGYPPREQDEDSSFDIPGAGNDDPYPETGRRYNAHYDYTVNPAPVFPLSDYDDDEVDTLAEDFNLAQDIRQSAGKGSAGGARQQPSIDNDKEVFASPSSSDSLATPGMQPPDAAAPGANESSIRPRSVNPAPDSFTTGVPGSTPPPVRARGGFASPSAAMVGPEPVPLPLPSHATRTGKSQRAQPPQAPSSRTGRPTNGWLSNLPLFNRTRSTPRKVRGAAPGAPVAKRWSSRFEIQLVLGIVILFICGLLAYFVPSANVTIALAAQDYSVPVQLTASESSKQSLALHTVQAHTLVYNTSVQGQGKATGSVQVGLSFAQGSVIFTYTGTGSVDIPTGIVLSTSNDVRFVTQADTQVVPGIVVTTPIVAQNAGTSGTVGANAITHIPVSSFNQIQQHNPTISLSANMLSVTNQTATSGGGATSVPAVSSSDSNTEKALLDQQLQARVQAWLQKQAHSGDVLGNPVRDETLTTRPTPGIPDKDANFSATLYLHLTVLAVRSADLQVGATAEFNHTLHQKQPGMVLLPGQKVSITKSASQATQNGSALTINLIAGGKIGKLLPADSVRNLIAGRNMRDARQNLLTADPRHIKNVTISVYPGITPWVPFFTRRIDVSFIAAPPPSPSPPLHPKAGPPKT